MSASADPAGDMIVGDSTIKSDTFNLTKPARAIRVAVAGNVTLITTAGSTVTCAFLAGETRAICATRILSTGTTATGIEVYC